MYPFASGAGFAWHGGEEHARSAASTFSTVVGQGLVGVELLGDLSSFIEDELQYYPGIRRDELRFHLFEAGNRLLRESKPFLAEYAERALRRRGAELHVATAVQEIGPASARRADGCLESRTIVLVRWRSTPCAPREWWRAMWPPRSAAGQPSRSCTGHSA